MRTRRRGGFTLIELLVVIAIIAILAAILFPVFGQARARASMVRCLSHLKQLAQALQQYSDDNNSRMPSVGWKSLAQEGNWCGCVTPGDWVYPERGQLWPYVKSNAMYVCTKDRNRKSVYVTAIPPGLSAGQYPLSYSMNTYADKVKTDSLAIASASTFMLLMHEDRSKINDGIYVPSRGGTRDIPDNVHYDGTTIAYLDGHARWARQVDLMAERDSGAWMPLP